jgi:hypothetical protein
VHAAQPTAFYKALKVTFSPVLPAEQVLTDLCTAPHTFLHALGDTKATEITLSISSLPVEKPTK